MRVRKRWKRIGWVALVVLVLAGWWWWSRPRVLRLEAEIPCDYHIIMVSGRSGFYDQHDLLLRLDRTADDRPAPGTLTLIGWDGKPRWQVSLPVVPSIEPRDQFNQPGCDDTALGVTALSPNGHWLALARREGGVVRVWRWRDGQALGTVTLRWPRECATSSYLLHITDTGRVWLVAKGIPCRLWAIDGARVATGSYAHTGSGTNELCVIWSISLSPDSSVLLCHYICSSGSTADYVTVGVQGTQVTTRCTCARLNDTDHGFHWLDGQTAIDSSGMCIGPQGKVTRITDWMMANRYTDGGAVVQIRDVNDAVRARVYATAPGRPWEIPADFDFHMASGCPFKDAICSSNGQVALALVDLRNNHLSRLMRKIPFLENLPHWESKWHYAVYSAPGRLRAVLPIINNDQFGPVFITGRDQHTSIEPFAVSSDGHHAAFIGNSATHSETAASKLTLMVYHW